ncbi:MAG: GNAT family N-acetyltransferase [Planctomycetota bacterium]|nr:GNAT family N-acetyltransferase [Planctomycetota bacterium]
MSTPAARASQRIRVRWARPDDVPTILALIRDLAEYEKAPSEVVATEESLRAHLFPAGGVRPFAECLMGEIKSGEIETAGTWTVQGFAVFFHNFSTWQGRAGVYLEDLFVRPEHRGAGLGKALLSAVAKIAVERGCPRYEWAVLDWNTPALDFYKAQGARGLDEWIIHRTTGQSLADLAAQAPKIEPA